MGWVDLPTDLPLKSTFHVGENISWILWVMMMLRRYKRRHGDVERQVLGLKRVMFADG